MEGKKFISHQDWSPIPRIPVHFTPHQSPLYIGPSHCNLTAVPVTHLSPSGHLSDRRMQTVTHTNVHEWRRKGERKKSDQPLILHYIQIHSGRLKMYSGQKKKNAPDESQERDAESSPCWMAATVSCLIQVALSFTEKRELCLCSCVGSSDSNMNKSDLTNKGATI